MMLQKLLETIMRLDNILEIKIYRINDNSNQIFEKTAQHNLIYFSNNIKSSLNSSEKPTPGNLINTKKKDFIYF